MKGINKAILIGNLGNDPEIRQTQDGRVVATLSLATSESWKDKNTGEKQERTEWHRVVAFGRLAEIIEKYTRKGDSLYIEGSIRTRKWTDKDGATRYSTEIVANEMQMLGGSRTESRGAAPRQLEPDKAPGGEAWDDDVPF